jgi:hypothetical protein
MRTEHSIVFGPAQQMGHLREGSVQLTVTSPPYPMVDMWNGILTEQNAAIGEVLAAEDGPLSAHHLGPAGNGQADSGGVDGSNDR